MPFDYGIEQQRFADGSNRWLWVIWYRGRVWRAGIEHQYDDARLVGERAWAQLCKSLSVEELALLPKPEDRWIANLDLIEDPPRLANETGQAPGQVEDLSDW